MKHLKNIFISILLFKGVVSGQNTSKLPQYYKALKLATSDSTKVEAYRNLCFNLSQTNPDSGIYFGNKGLEIAEKINYTKGIGDCYNSIGWCQIKKGDYANAKTNLLQAKAAFEQLGNKCYLSVVYSNLGNLYFNQNINAEALDYFLKAIKLTEGCPDEGFKSSGIYSVGTIYNTQKEFHKAIHYFREAYQINVINHDHNKNADCMNGIGNAHIGLKNYDSALFYLEQSFKTYLAYSNLYGAGYAKESIGSVYFEKNQLDLALENYKQAKDNFEKAGSKYDICYELLTIGDVYQKKGDITTAIAYKRSALQKADSNQFMSLKQQALRALSDLYSQKKDYKNAFNYYKLSNSIKDSLALEQQQIKLNEIKTKYETEKKDKAIALLNKDKLVSLAESNRQKLLKNIFIVGTVVFLLLALILYNRYQIKRKSSIALAEKNKQIQIEKERAETSEKFKQRFLANMSHEIRTPMTAILGMTELLEDYKLPQPQQKYLEAIKQSSQNLLELINDILDLSKLEAGKTVLHKMAFDLHQMLNHIQTLFIPMARSKNLNFNLDIQASIPQYIVSDPKRLNQILLNLVGNAFKFTQTGSINLRVDLDDQHLHFSIRDTGSGIAEKDLQAIFQAFHQSNTNSYQNFGGTGLGLTIAKNLITALNGLIKVESKIGEGSLFSFSIPFEVANENNIKNINDPIVSFDHLAQSPLHIILAEDNAYNRLLVVDGLKKKFNSIRFTIAENGEQLIQILKNKIEWKPYERSLILMDIQMPEMDGYTTTRIIRNEFPKPLNAIPVLALTASVIKRDIEECLNAGMNDFISKPFEIKTLISKVQEHASIISFPKANEETVVLSDHEPIIDLNYLLDFTENDNEEMQKYISIFKSRIPILFSEANAMLERNNVKRIVEILHSAKPILGSFGMKNCESIISEIEQSATKITHETLKSQLKNIEQSYLQALQELKKKYPF